MALRLVLVDSGGSNLASVQAAFQRLGVEAPVTTDWQLIQSASHVVLPGVGAAAPSMARLQRHGLVSKLPTLTQPVLGVCVGMQLLFEHSVEGDVPCLGIIPGQVQRLAASPNLRVPHMGWNRIHVLKQPQAVAPEHVLKQPQAVAPEHVLKQPHHPITAGLDNEFAYFVHSFAAPLSAYTIASCQHASSFSAMAVRDNFIGAQFHPERSQQVGARLLKNFLELR